MATPQFNIRIDSDLKERFLEKAKQEGFTGSDLIVRWVKTYLGEMPETSLPAATQYLDERVGEVESELRARIEELENNFESRFEKARAELVALIEEGMGKQAA